MFVPAFPGQVCSLGYQVGGLVEEAFHVQLTAEQVRMFLALYQLDPVTGRRLVRRGAIRRPKGWGKSPIGACVGFGEFVGPVRFSHWDRDGQPVGRPHPDPWVQFAAVSEDQTANVMDWLFDRLADNPAVAREHGLDIARSRILFRSRSGKLEVVTAAAGSREGQRLTCAVLDQTEAWFRENGGVRLAATLRRNVAKDPTGAGITLELQNAPEPGDGSVADDTGRHAGAKDPGIWFDTREPDQPPDFADRESLATGLRVAYGDSVRDLHPEWGTDVSRLVDECQDPATDIGDALRYYFNLSQTATARAFDRQRWAQLGVDDIPMDGPIVAGFDGARFDDSVALVACHVESGIAWPVQIWERPERVDDWEVDELDVTNTVADLFETRDVWRLYADPPYWESTVASWAAKWGRDRIVEWWTNRWRAVGYACRSLATAIRTGDVHHDGDEVLTAHVLNAVRRRVSARDEDGRPLWSIAKESPGRKIDGAMALVLAWEARNDAIAAGVLTPVPVRRRRGWST